MSQKQVKLYKLQNCQSSLGLYSNDPILTSRQVSVSISDYFSRVPLQIESILRVCLFHRVLRSTVIMSTDAHAISLFSILSRYLIHEAAYAYSTVGCLFHGMLCVGYCVHVRPLPNPDPNAPISPPTSLQGAV